MALTRSNKINADTNIDATVEAEMANFDADWASVSDEWSKELELV